MYNPCKAFANLKNRLNLHLAAQGESFNVSSLRLRHFFPSHLRGNSTAGECGRSLILGGHKRTLLTWAKYVVYLCNTRNKLWSAATVRWECNNSAITVI